MNTPNNVGSKTRRDTVSYLVYDGECPFCSRYVRLLRLRAAVGAVELVDARTDHPMVSYLYDLGIDLDEGMALVQDNVIAHGVVSSASL